MAVFTGEMSDSSSDGSSSGFVKAYSVPSATNTGDKGLKTVGIVLEKSPFYAEAGGQINDIGQLEVITATGDNEGASLIFDVIDVQSYGGYVYEAPPTLLSYSCFATFLSLSLYIYPAF